MSFSFTRWFRNQKQTRKFHPSWIAIGVLGTLLVMGIVWIPAFLLSKTANIISLDADTSPRTDAAGASSVLQAGESSQAIEASAKPDQPDAPKVRVRFAPPAPDAIPEGELGDAIRLGRKIFKDTQTYAREYVGNGLNCVNCHLDAGRKTDSAPLWAAYGMFPAYRDKNKKVNSYEDRLAGCFRFSMNGKPPAPDSKVMLALVSYSAWLAKGAPIGLELEGRGYPKLDKPPQKPDASRGKQVFADHCAICHGADGHGTRAGDIYAFPPLWGPDSFNGGAGMSKPHNATAFIKANMPLGKGGSLSLQDAWDVAQFMDSQERPPDPRKSRS